MILKKESGKIISMEKLVLIDGNSLLNRAYYATPVFTTRSGVPTNGIFGFVKLLFKILEDVKPEYIIVAFDLKAPTFRHKMYSEYKATRKGMPDDLASQVEPLKNLLKAMNIAVCTKEGIEADDIIGTLSNKYGVHSYIYTGDRDSFQLVDEKTDVYYTKRGVSDLLKLNIENFKEETGLNVPSQIIDLKALMGDSSDNIPGVPGIGEKTALDLLSKYETLDGVYENIGYLKGSTREKIFNNREIAYLSYKLATIDRNCELDIKLEDCISPQKYNVEVKKIFRDFEFRSFLSLDIFSEEACSENTEIDYPEKINCKSYEEAASLIGTNKEFGFVLCETGAEIYSGGKQLSVKLAGDLLDIGITSEDFTKILRLIFSKEQNKVITFNCKTLMHAVKKSGVEFKCAFDDVALAKYLCDYYTSSLDLKELCEYYLYDYEYSAYTVCKLFERYRSMLETENMLSLYEDIEKPLLTILYDMEESGVEVSVNMLDELAKRFEAQMEDYKSKVFDKCGCKFNLNSPSQLGDVLFNKLGISAVKKKKTGKFSTAADVLEKLKDEYPVVNDILKFRLYQKLYSTYIEGFRPLIGNDSLVHTTYNQTITTTGRLSSVNPNLQNIPIREDEGRELRKIFVARNGNVLIDADYSQIELRLLAHFSDCKELIDAYRIGEDIHSITASQVFGVPIEEVTQKMRREAKAVNFGIIYGISDFGLSKNLGIPLATAKEYIEKYFKTYSAVKNYMNENIEFARKKGYVSTLTGRKRVIPEINSSNFNLRQFGERAAMNMPLQGSSADIIKIAMINVHKALSVAGLKAKLILQVHDELVIDAPENEAEKAAEILKYEMENSVKLKVPLTVEIHSGRNWYDAK